MRLWHFTSEVHLPMIADAGYLRPTESNLHMTQAHAGPDCVWFMDGPDLSEGKDGLLGSAVDKTAVRIEVEVPDARVRAWYPWALAQGIHPAWLARLLAVAGGEEAAQRWQVVFRRVPKEQWIKVEVRQPDGTWKEVQE